MIIEKFEKPLYSVYARVYGSGTIMVNDVPILDWMGEDTKDGGYGGDIPINHVLLQSGTYQVIGSLLPRAGEKTIHSADGLSLDFYTAEADKWKETRFNDHPKIETPWDGLSENIDYPTFQIVTEIEVDLPFVLDGWQNSLNLKDLEKKALFKEVLNYYKQVHLILKEGNAARYLALSQEKMNLQEQAFYFSEQRKKSFLEAASGLFAQGMEVERLEEHNLEMQIFGQGRLVRLVNRNGLQALQFKSKNPEEQSNVEMEIKLHMRSKEKGFSII